MPDLFDEAKECSRKNPRCSRGVDLFVLETFSDISEMRQAIRAVREMCDLPIVAQMTILPDGNTSFGTTPEVFTSRLDEWGADVIGLNCGVGPAIVLTGLEKMRGVTHKKLSAQPNAGLPRDVQGRQFYMCSPEYMAKFAKRLIQAGAKFIGGCLAHALAHQAHLGCACAPPARASSMSSSRKPRRACYELTRLTLKYSPEERSHWARKITNGEFVTSSEFLPPKGCAPYKTLRFDSSPEGSGL